MVSFARDVLSLSNNSKSSRGILSLCEIIMSKDYSNKNVSILNVGNVLVDIEITISDDDLSNLPIKKGGAIEINIIQLDKYLNIYQDQITNKYLGGSIFTTAATSSAFEIDNSFLGSVGKDSNSKYLIDTMNSYPIKTYLNVDLQQTGCCLIFLTPDKERTMAACPGASSQLTLANFENLESIDFIFTDLYSLNSDINKETISYLLSTNKNLILSLSDISVMIKHIDFIKKYSDQTSIIAGNESEMKFLQQHMSSSFIDSSLETNKVYLTTMGAKGSEVIHDGKLYKSHSIQTEIASLNGAGDTFLGAFIGNYFQSRDIQQSADIANYFSHCSIQRHEACLDFTSLLEAKNAAKATFSI